MTFSPESGSGRPQQHPCCPAQVLSARLDEQETATEAITTQLSAIVGQQVSDNTHLTQL